MRSAPALLAGLLAVTACSGSTETLPAETPESAALEVDGVLSGDNFAKITFAPSTLATVADVAGEHFHKTVTGGGELGSGTLTIGYGHDEGADELTFGPLTVSVVATAQ